MTEGPRIHLLGASCTGVSTLGARLAAALDLPLLDVDAFYWLPTDPPFAEKRPPEDRVRLVAQRQAEPGGWILAGSLIGWGDALVRDADLIVFLHLAAELRLQRLDRREAGRYGARIRPGGDMHASHLAFRDWASRYDDPAFYGRSRARHEAWLAARTAPVLRLDGAAAADDLARAVTRRLGRA